MASDQTDNTDGLGCMHYGCGTAGVLVAGLVISLSLSILVPLFSSFSDLACAERDSEPYVETHAAAHSSLPELIIYQDERLRLNDSGMALRNDDTVSYHTYQELWKEDGDVSITIEGDPAGDLSAVVTERIHASDLQRVEKEEDSQDESDEEGVDSNKVAQT